MLNDQQGSATSATDRVRSPDAAIATIGLSAAVSAGA